MNEATTSQAAGSPAEITLDDGKTYWLGQMDMDCWGRFEQWVRSEIMAVAYDSLPEDLRRAQRIIRETTRYAHSLSLTPMDQLEANEDDFEPNEMQTRLATPAGMFEVVWLSLHKAQPGLRREKVRELVASLETLGKAFSRIMEMSPFFRIRQQDEQAGGEAE